MIRQSIGFAVMGALTAYVFPAFMLGQAQPDWHLVAITAAMYSGFSVIRRAI